MLAPERFGEWLSQNNHVDGFGHAYHYHPRSDAHSVALCTFIAVDLLNSCPPLRSKIESGEMVFGINAQFRWKATGKVKRLDLAIGPPREPVRLPLQSTLLSVGSHEETPVSLAQLSILKADFADVVLSCEAKSVMTEHKKSQPRVYDELNSSYQMVHQGRQDAIACGITVVNIADTFISPLRQTRLDGLHVTQHRQPKVAADMINHLRGLPIRDAVGQVGFDAYATFVVDCSNRCDEPAVLWTAPPAPQPRERDHYVTFLQRIDRAFTDRFGS